MYKFTKLFEGMEFTDVEMLYDEVTSGRLEKYLEKKIAFMKSQGHKVCPVCGSLVDLSRKEHLALDFGPKDFRKRAHFDAMDCMEYFVAKLKKMEEDHDSGSAEKIYEKRYAELVRMLSERNQDLSAERQHQIYGAIYEIRGFLDAIAFLYEEHKKEESMHNFLAVDKEKKTFWQRLSKEDMK